MPFEVLHIYRGYQIVQYRKALIKFHTSIFIKKHEIGKIALNTKRAWSTEYESVDDGLKLRIRWESFGDSRRYPQPGEPQSIYREFLEINRSSLTLKQEKV